MSYLHHTTEFPNLWKISTAENKRKKTSFFPKGKNYSKRHLFHKF